MNDFEYVAQFSKSPENSFGDLNDGLTKACDAMFGPDAVDAFDASCNTCKHFLRKPMTPQERRTRNLFGMPGSCAVKLVPVTGWQRGQFCGFENAACYENRRTGMGAGLQEGMGEG